MNPMILVQLVPCSVLWTGDLTIFSIAVKLTSMNSELSRSSARKEKFVEIYSSPLVWVVFIATFYIVLRGFLANHISISNSIAPTIIYGLLTYGVYRKKVYACILFAVLMGLSIVIQGYLTAEGLKLPELRKYFSDTPWRDYFISITAYLVIMVCSIILCFKFVNLNQDNSTGKG